MIVISRAYYSDCTLGRLFTVDFSCHTLELPWRGNNSSTDFRKASCIPEGTYSYRVAMSPRLGRLVIWVDNVPGRTAIQLHPGNYTSNILGCCLVGDGVRDINKDGTPDVTNSTVIFNALLAAIPAQGQITFRTATIPGSGVFKQEM